jgi:hypothetical protein
MKRTSFFTHPLFLLKVAKPRRPRKPRRTEFQLLTNREVERPAAVASGPIDPGPGNVEKGSLPTPEVVTADDEEDPVE